MSPPMPPEMTDKIIDFMDERPLLLVTSLVAKSWRSRSQSRLYESITLLTPSRLHSFETLIVGSDHLAPYVKGMEIGSLSSHITGPFADIRDYESPTAYISMKNLQVITVQGVIIDGKQENIHETTICRFLAQFPSLTSLHFNHCDIHYSILPPLITVALALSELGILDCSTSGDPDFERAAGEGVQDQYGVGEEVADGGRQAGDEVDGRLQGVGSDDVEQEEIGGIVARAQGEFRKIHELTACTDHYDEE